MEKPLLSIGMIFKNEIRCLERCMKSLEPLRQAIPCELVMADTGSDDGSWEVAAKYADILFEVPWINDFSAARNAVMDRCSGEWFLSIDADEWLDKDISQLLKFLTNEDLWKWSFCGMIVRNYMEQEMEDGDYNDFLAVRLVRLSTGVRNVGAIHEMWDHHGDVYGLGKTILHHDGYVSAVKGLKNKTERNMKPLREMLEQDPANLKILLQCLESAQEDSSYAWYIHQAATAVEQKRPLWEYFGPPILRYAILWAAGQHAPELERWASEMEEWFPDSIYTRIDALYVLFILSAEEAEYLRTISMGQRYLQALAEYREGQFNHEALIVSSLMMSTKSREDSVRVILADQYFHQKDFQQAHRMLLSVDLARIRSEMMENYMGVLLNLQAQSGEDLSSVMLDLWEKVSQSKKVNELRAAVLRASAIAFSSAHRKAEAESGYIHAYTVFLPLEGKCGIGDAAAILEAEDTSQMETILARQTDFSLLPISAITHALEQGARFPLPEQKLNIETADSLASRMAGDQDSFLPIALHAAEEPAQENIQELLWRRGLLMAAVQTYRWKAEDWDEGQGLILARAFAQVEWKFLYQYYASSVLCEENLNLLPPVHRFGWYCAQAFDALENGDATGYVHLLREGLALCEGMKDMVGFLVEHTEEVQAAMAPPPELQALANQVRAILARYDPNDPAVTALKQSEAYQKVAYLLERQ